VDVLHWPLIGGALRWRHARLVLQVTMLTMAVIVVVHGLWGPQLAPTNLATILTWIHYRGLLIGMMLAAGNVFCGGCPFILVRDIGRRMHAPTIRWPRRLRGKWIGLALFVAVLFAYELFDLWALPRATAWLVAGYFGAALTVDLFFSGASFCKHLCPIGQFSFIASTMSPLELKVRERATCNECRTADCINGRPLADARLAGAQRGCELGLFLPAKVGNLDCTFCLDCVHACPHDNITLALRPPGEELAIEGRRSGIGRLTNRADLAALALLFAFGGLLNAFAMTAPVYGLEAWVAGVLSARSEVPVLALLFLVVLGGLPLLLCGAAAMTTRHATASTPTATARIAIAFAYVLVPFGFAVWLSHYGFHLLTGALTVVPAMQSAAADVVGRSVLGTPRWNLTGLRPGLVFPIQVGFLLLGMTGSLALAHRVATRDYPDRAWLAATPWFVLVVGLAALAVWILAQPMEMRGVSFGG
jgi:polyferredoxin